MNTLTEPHAAGHAREPLTTSAPEAAPDPTPWVAKQAGHLDRDSANVIAAELASQGVSEAWAQELIMAAAAHRSPLAGGSLRDAVHAMLAASIPAPTPLPATGAAIAFVGAGGVGKTRCAANVLRSLSLDAVYIAVPATFSVHASRKLVEGFAAVGADGIAVTHADEADQLGIAAELASISGMPIAYIHEGLELDGAVSAVDPSSLAARLLSAG